MLRFFRLLLAGGALSWAASLHAQSPSITETPLFVSGQGYNTYRIPAIARTTNGTLLAFTEARASISDGGNIDIVMRRSTNNGVSWEAMQLVTEEGGTASITIGNPAPVVDETTGHIFLLFCRNNSQVFYTVSTNDGVSWADRVEITSTCKQTNWGWYATGPGHGIQLKRGAQAGRLVVPTDHQTTGGTYGDHVIYSDDHGATWQLGAVQDASGGVNPNENEAVELVTPDISGGSHLYFNSRDHGGAAAGTRAEGWSTNGGSTYVGPFTNNTFFLTPVCQGSVLRFRGTDEGDSLNRILFASPNNSSRVNLSLWSSTNELVSWSAPKSVYAGQSAYSDMARTASGDLALICEKGVASAYETITVFIMNEAWLDAPAPPAPPESVPVPAFWNLEEKSAGAVCDTTPGAILDVDPAGYTNHLTAQSSFSYVTGAPNYGAGTALQFDGTGGLVLSDAASSNHFDFDATNSFTIEVVFRVATNYTAIGGLVAKDLGGTQPSWWLRLESGRPRFLVSDNAVESFLSTTNTVNDGQWHHLAAVRDASDPTNKTIALWLDGVLNTNRADLTTGSLANGQAFNIGRFNASGRNLVGDIDFVRITPAAFTNASQFVTNQFVTNASTFTLTYTAGPNGAISGTSPQTVGLGASGTAVAAVPSPGYSFVNWSDGLTNNPRTDVNVTSNITVTANFNTSLAGPNFGHVAVIGDSITQATGNSGAYAQNGNRGYRWHLFKQLVDADATFDFVGSLASNYATDSAYPSWRNIPFNRVNEGHYAWRAYQILGFKSEAPGTPTPGPSTSNRGIGNIGNWLDDAQGGYTADTATIMIGINDLSEGRGAALVRDDVARIIDNLQADNPNVRIYLLELLHVASGHVAYPGLNTTANDYNTNYLAPLAAAKTTASSTVSVVSMLNGQAGGYIADDMTYDNIHPNSRGEAYVAGRIAAAMGVTNQWTSVTITNGNFEGGFVNAGTSNCAPVGWTIYGQPNAAAVPKQITDYSVVAESIVDLTATGTNTTAGSSYVIAGNADTGIKQTLTDVLATNRHYLLQASLYKASAALTLNDWGIEVWCGGTKIAQADNQISLLQYVTGTASQIGSKLTEVTIEFDANDTPSVIGQPLEIRLISRNIARYVGFEDLRLSWRPSSVSGGKHYRVYVLTGQSNSLGTDNGSEVNKLPGFDFADAQVPFFWHNCSGDIYGVSASPGYSIGSSAGFWKTMRAQPGFNVYSTAVNAWGPEINFARTMFHSGQTNIAIIKASRGGGGNSFWLKSNFDNHMYVHVTNTVLQACNRLTADGNTYEITGLLYLQGESNSAGEAAVAGQRFKDLVDNLRADLPNASAMKGYMVGNIDSGADDATTRAQQEAVAAANPSYLAYVDSLDMTDELAADNLHHNRKAKFVNGARFAQMVLGKAASFNAAAGFAPAYGQQYGNSTAGVTPLTGLTAVLSGSSPQLQGWSEEPALRDTQVASPNQSAASVSDSGTPAWNITDGDATGAAYFYTRKFSGTQTTNYANSGWVYSLNARFPTGYAENPSFFFQYGDASIRWLAQLKRDLSGALTATFTNGVAAQTVTLQASYDNAYHSFVLRKSSSGTSAELVFDGVTIGTVSAVAADAALEPGVHFGTRDAAGKGAANVATVDFSAASVTASNTLIYFPNSNGSISGSATQTVAYAGSGTAVTAVPDANFIFTGWSDGVTNNTRTDTNVVFNLSVAANFVADNVVFTPTFNPPAGGYITNALAVTISDATPGATIYYTTNGVNWSTGASGLTVAVPVPVAGFLIQAYATADGITGSATNSVTYSTVLSPIWTSAAASGSWASGVNWSNTVIASGTSVTADFSQVSMTQNETVTLDGAQTVGGLLFGGNYNWTLDTGVGGTLTLAVTNSSPVISNSVSTTIGAVINGTQGLTKTGNGTLAVTAANTYSGGTTISTGQLQLGNGGNNTASLGAGDVSIATGTTLSLAWSSGVVVLANNLAGSGTVIRGGTSEIALTGANTFSGLYQITNSTLAFRTMNSAAGQPRISVTSPGNLALGNDFAGQTCTISELSGSGGVNPQFDAVSGTKTLNIAQTATTTFSGVMRDATTGSRYLAVTKSGAGTLTLSGANTYTGATTVSNGTLLVNGSLAVGSAVTVAGGTLGGTGTVNGSVTVQSGGGVTPGNGVIGTLTINNTLDFSSGQARMKISKTGGALTNDSITGVTTLTYGGTLTVTNVTSDGTPLAAGDSFKLFNAGAYTGSFAATNLPPLNASLVWNWNPATGTLSVTDTNAPLVLNGGFEAGSFANWTQSGGSGSVSTTSTYVHSGAYGARLGPTTMGYLSQTLTTVPGQAYVLSFWLKNVAGGSTEIFQADWNGTNVYAITNPPAFAWSNLTFIVTATGSSTVLQFGFRNDPSYFGLDDISVTPTNVTLTYLAGPNGSIGGATPQVVSYNGSGTAVSAVANPGYHFVNWSDSSTANPRTEASVTNNVTVTANFALIPAGVPVITNLAMAADRTSFTITGTGTPLANYVLLAATNLPPTWVALLTNTTGTNGMFQFTDLQTTNFNQRFYRIQSQ